MPADPQTAVCCEACGMKRRARHTRWYVDPEGVELCPGCADDLHAAWVLEGFDLSPPQEPSDG